MRATVSRVIEETAQCRSFELEPPQQRRAAFAALPGQFIPVCVAIDGVAYERSYSVSSVAALGEPLRITIKQTPGGSVSTWCNDRLEVGSEILIGLPAGRFSVQPGSEPVLFVAAGSGVTPIFAMLRDVLRDGKRTATLVYVNRSPEQAIFLAELRRLRDDNLDRMRLIEIYSDGSPDRIDRAVAEYIRANPDANVYVCGPAAFMERVERSAEAAGAPHDRIFTESFNAEPPAKSASDAPRSCAAYPCSLAEAVGIPDLRVHVRGPDGGIQEIRVKAGGTLLDALKKTEGARVGVCGGQGACGTCRISVGPRWTALVAELRRREHRLLNALAGHEPDHRLACQIPLDATLDGVEITPAPVA